MVHGALASMRAGGDAAKEWGGKQHAAREAQRMSRGCMRKRAADINVVEDLNLLAQVLSQLVPGGVPVGRDQRPHDADGSAHDDGDLRNWTESQNSRM